MQWKTSSESPHRREYSPRSQCERPLIRRYARPKPAVAAFEANLLLQRGLTTPRKDMPSSRPTPEDQLQTSSDACSVKRAAALMAVAVGGEKTIRPRIIGVVMLGAPANVLVARYVGIV